MKVVGCVPAYNNESSVAMSVESLLKQTLPLEDVFVVDDGSTDETRAQAERAGARVIAMGSNQGRGAARARCVEEAQRLGAHLMLSVDGTASLAPDFLALCLPWFDDPEVCAVYGRIGQLEARTVADRWRGRHLYRLDDNPISGRASTLITWGFALDVEKAMKVGNFDPRCRHSEDLELGHRLSEAGWKIIYEPAAVLTTLVSNTVTQVTERWRRWSGLLERQDAIGWMERRQLLAMLWLKDLQAIDFPSFLVSYSAVKGLTCPARAK